ncbi:energy transducer TonB [Iodidimonas sp. SYSU 1G8]|uniref:energy transducer TonB n=1 Tax=Iodidimonas sp. SYSU 1G8 TaxID=3133967 RepID=UPI0031FEDEE7
MHIRALVFLILAIFCGACPASAAPPGVRPILDDPMVKPPTQDPAYPITQPPYPLMSVMAAEQGAVILRFIVRDDGSVDPATVTVEEGSGSAVLDGAAVAEAANWRFRPATSAGVPVASPHLFRVVFELSSVQGMQAGGNNPQEKTPLPRQSRPITQPPYPRSAVEAGAEGDVLLRFIVKEDGYVDPSSIVVKKSSGFADLDKAAVDEAARNWRFQPATLYGTPVASPHEFRVVFALKKKQRPD